MVNPYNEYNYAEQMIKRGFITKHYLKEVIILGKYLKYKDNSLNDIKAYLTDFCNKYIPEYNEVLFINFLKKAIKTIKKSKLLIIDKISISKLEMDKIEQLSSVKAKKFALTCLVLAKIQYIKTSSNFIYDKRSQIVKKSNISQSKKSNQHTIINEMYRLDMIRLCMNGSLEIKFIDSITPEDVVFEVSDFDNIGNHYLKHLEGGYKYCVECGRLIKITVNNRKRCEECAIENLKEAKREVWHKYKHKYRQARKTANRQNMCS